MTNCYTCGKAYNTKYMFCNWECEMKCFESMSFSNAARNKRYTTPLSSIAIRDNAPLNTLLNLGLTEEELNRVFDREIQAWMRLEQERMILGRSLHIPIMPEIQTSGLFVENDTPSLANELQVIRYTGPMPETVTLTSSGSNWYRTYIDTDEDSE